MYHYPGRRALTCWLLNLSRLNFLAAKSIASSLLYQTPLYTLRARGYRAPTHKCTVEAFPCATLLLSSLYCTSRCHAKLFPPKTYRYHTDADTATSELCRPSAARHDWNVLGISRAISTRTKTFLRGGEWTISQVSRCARCR